MFSDNHLYIILKNCQAPLVLSGIISSSYNKLWAKSPSDLIWPGSSEATSNPLRHCYCFTVLWAAAESRLWSFKNMIFLLLKSPVELPFALVMYALMAASNAP